MDAVVILAVASFLLGMLVNKMYHSIFNVSGTLNIYHSDPNKDIYRFEVGDLDALSKKKHITLKVKHNMDLSQK